VDAGESGGASRSSNTPPVAVTDATCDIRDDVDADGQRGVRGIGERLVGRQGPGWSVACYSGCIWTGKTVGSLGWGGFGQAGCANAVNYGFSMDVKYFSRSAKSVRLSG